LRQGKNGGIGCPRQRVAGKTPKPGRSRRVSRLPAERYPLLDARRAVVGGYVRGDHAVILFDGSGLFDALHGEVILHRAGNTWLVADELVQIGQR
jgi:hypothetical protein